MHACGGFEHGEDVRERGWSLVVLPEQRGCRERQGDDEKLACTGSGSEVFDSGWRLKERQMGESEGRDLLLVDLWIKRTWWEFLIGQCGRCSTHMCHFLSFFYFPNLREEGKGFG